jgi:hypothetical protein
MRNQGQRNPNARLLQREVEEIRRSSLPQAFLARKYKVSQQTISEIWSRKTWRTSEQQCPRK